MQAPFSARSIKAILALLVATCTVCMPGALAWGQPVTKTGDDISAVLDRELGTDAGQGEKVVRPVHRATDAPDASIYGPHRDSLNSEPHLNSDQSASAIDEGHPPRFVGHFMGSQNSAERVPLLYASPRAFEWPFERELDDIRSAEALVRNWTRYRDEDVVVEMDPLSTSVRIVLPFNRSLKGTDR
jgi:hypothetical protein